jgi:rhodanese-related sulfurtransferase
MKRIPILALLVIPVLLFIAGCSKDDDSPVQPTINESELLVQALEGADGGYLNTTCPAIVDAKLVYEDINGPKKWYLIDVRAAADYALGHVATAVNVPIANILEHMKTITPNSYEKIVIICYTGQSAAYTTAILRMAGYSNAFSMKFGMSSWHKDFDRVTSKVSSQYISQFVATDFPKAAAGSLPTISTGKTTGADILKVRVDSVLAQTYSKVSIDAATVMANPANYYIVNYWPVSDYTLCKHIPGAIQYTPKADLKLSTFLKTLPTDKTIVVYCYTGQTSGNVATILRVMGYDARSLSFGTNGMIWQTMKDNSKTRFEQAVDCNDFPYVK